MRAGGLGLQAGKVLGASQQRRTCAIYYFFFFFYYLWRSLLPTTQRRQNFVLFSHRSFVAFFATYARPRPADRKSGVLAFRNTDLSPVVPLPRRNRARAVAAQSSHSPRF